MQIQISWLLKKPTDLDLHCLQRQGISGFSRTRVNNPLIRAPAVTHVLVYRFHLIKAPEKAIFQPKNGVGWVRRGCPVAFVTGVLNWYWLTVWQGLLSLQQARIEGECYYFFCFFTFFHFPLSSLALSFISSTISSISFLPLSGRRHK